MGCIPYYWYDVNTADNHLGRFCCSRTSIIELPDLKYVTDIGKYDNDVLLMMPFEPKNCLSWELFPICESRTYLSALISHKLSLHVLV